MSAGLEPKRNTSKCHKSTCYKNMQHSVEKDKKPKQLKKNCNTWSDPIGGIPIDISTVKSKVPQNTDRSDSSDCMLLEVLEKGKKLRDAMVLSVLEDVDTGLNDGIVINLDHSENKCASYKPLKKNKNGEVVSPHEEKLIKDYLEGKNMKEEEEMLVLSTLHSVDEKLTTDNKMQENGLKNTVDSCCLSSRVSCPHSFIQTTSRLEKNNTALLNSRTISFIDSEKTDWMAKINCFRLTVENLVLTKGGWKKINQTLESKNKCVDTVPPPGATYFVECHFLQEPPSSQPWKSSPLRFCSRRQIENVIYFGQSCAHSLRAADKAMEELSNMTCLVCWRHLNQRVPSLLGHFSLVDLLIQPNVDMAASIPVIDNDNQVILAHLSVRLELGKDKLHFGTSLLGDNSAACSDEKILPENRMRIEDISSNVKTPKFNGNLQQNKNIEIIDNDGNRESKNCPIIAICSKCEQRMAISAEFRFCSDCVSKQQASFSEPVYKCNVPKTLDSLEERHHEFLLGIDTVVGFPVFSGVDDELSCYVDYKFPEISSKFKAEMGKSESTSRVVDCNVQPLFESVHKHCLTLPVVLPLSPLLAACSPGVSLRLWLRYYKPTPRDHMVAMALLPMDEICLMELEFDKKKSVNDAPVVKVLDLPLALVPSSVTAPYQQHKNLGVLRVSLSYSNNISTPLSAKAKTSTVLPSPQFYDNSTSIINSMKIKEKYSNLSSCESQSQVARDTYLQQSTNVRVGLLTEKDQKTAKNRFWTGPFEKDAVTNSSSNPQVGTGSHHDIDIGINTESAYLPKHAGNMSSSNNTHGHKNVNQDSDRPVLKEDFDLLAENIEKRFNQLQSDLIKERQKAFSDVSKNVTSCKKSDSFRNESDDDFLGFHSITSSMESLPFMLGPPADYRELQNTVVFSKSKKPSSNTQSGNSSIDTISGFFMENKEVTNLGSNDTMEKKEKKIEPVKQRTFKVRIKVDRAVNLKGVKGPTNGKKGKFPPSTWVCFGTGECCDQNCGTSSVVCSGTKFSTPVIRRNFNPIWNLAWDVDLPIEYLQNVNKRLVFRVFEENLDVAFGFASANLSILISGLPCLSSWLSINDLAGSCKGQIKIAITPLEDLSKYQESSAYDPEEVEFEEMKNNIPSCVTSNNKQDETDCSSTSQAESFTSKNKIAVNNIQEEDHSVKNPEKVDEDVDREDPVSADDIISDYKTTLENNFRNEMAGLENLIKFLRVGSMSNEISFLSSNENKENSNPTFLPLNSDSRSSSSHDLSCKISGRCSSVGNQATNLNGFKERVFIDASTETMNRDDVPSGSTQNSGEDIISKLLQQISMFQPPAIKIVDNTSQTIKPETKESYTETVVENNSAQVQTRTVHLKDACTETEELGKIQSETYGVGSHICGELGSVLLQHFLTCKPTPIKTCDNSCQTTEPPTSTDSSGLLFRSLPSGVSSEVLNDNTTTAINPFNDDFDFISSEEAHTNCERLIEIDNNIKNLERFLEENLKLTENDQIPSLNAKEDSPSNSGNEPINAIQDMRTEDEMTSSDIDSLVSFSQEPDFIRETPDGGNNPTDTRDLTLDSDASTTTATTLRRRGTFVIDKSKDNSGA